MRCLSCAFWPTRAALRSSNSLRLAVDHGLDVGVGRGRVEQGLRKADRSIAALLRLEPRLSRVKPVQTLGDDGKAGAGHRVVEPDQHVAGLHGVTVVDPELADDAAGRVLHLLDVGIDHDRALRDQRAGDLCGRGPAAEAAGEHQHDGKADDEMDGGSTALPGVAVWS